MKTYSEEMGKEPFDWHEFLNKNEFTKEELEKACSLSSNWPTCAVGNQCACIPRDRYGGPIDSPLYKLGRKFDEIISEIYESYDIDSGYVNEEYIVEAKNILDKIEQRSAELIHQNENKN